MDGSLPEDAGAETEPPGESLDGGDDIDREVGEPVVEASPPEETEGDRSGDAEARDDAPSAGAIDILVSEVDVDLGALVDHGEGLLPEPHTPADSDDSRPLDGPSDLDEARDTGDTGKTGETVFVGAAAQRAFGRGADGSMVGDAMSDEEEDTLPRADRRRLFTRVLPVLLLLAVIIFSYRKLAEIDSRSGSEGSSSGAQVEEEPAPQATSTGDVLAKAGADRVIDEVDLPPLPARGTPLKAFLEHEVEWVRPGEPISFSRLDSGVVEANRVTVLNLWATWCKPCKSELPDLKGMFKKAEWGDRVRFASILSQDGVSPSTAHRDFAAKMPSAEYFFAEVSSTDTTLADALRKRGLIKDGGLPITVVLDCRRDVRFAHQGRLGPRNFEDLRGMIDTLVGELGGEFCANKPRKRVVSARLQPEAADQAPPSFEAPTVDPFVEPPKQAGVERKKIVCGDGRCTQGAETCQSCPQDCACTENSECKKSQSGSYTCVLAASLLKD